MAKSLSGPRISVYKLLTSRRKDEQLLPLGLQPDRDFLKELSNPASLGSTVANTAHLIPAFLYVSAHPQFLHCPSQLFRTMACRICWDGLEGNRQ